MIVLLVCSFIIILLEGFFLFFLRDPDRIPPAGDVILCPADGLVIGVEQDNAWDKISIFMNPLNVHVQWVPYPGKVLSIERIEGAARPGFLPDSSTKNNQVITTMDTRIGRIIVKQIVGILVRRIQVYLPVGSEVKTGQRLGRIIFGSRVELWLPKGKAEIKVKELQRVLAGYTIAGVLK
jgi:phosphatidylserine decarboxylase